MRVYKRDPKGQSELENEFGDIADLIQIILLKAYPPEDFKTEPSKYNLCIKERITLKDKMINGLDEGLKIKK